MGAARREAAWDEAGEGGAGSATWRWCYIACGLTAPIFAGARCRLRPPPNSQSGQEEERRARSPSITRSRRRDARSSKAAHVGVGRTAVWTTCTLEDIRYFV